MDTIQEYEYLYKVSVIIPMYGCEEFVADLLEMLHREKMKEVEYLCVIDGSSAQIADIVKHFREKDSRFVLLKQEHSGAGKARNTGLKHASGKYVMFMDADDLIVPSYIKKMYFTAEDNRADIVMCKYMLLSPENGIQEKTKGFEESMIPTEKVFDPSSIEDLYEAVEGKVWGRIYSRDLINQNKIECSETISFNDLFFGYTALHCARRVYATKEALCVYRWGINRNSISRRNRMHPEIATDAFLQVYNDLYSWLEAKDLNRKYLQSFCWKWRTALNSLIYTEFKEEVAEMVAIILGEALPWCVMTDKQLFFESGLDTVTLNKYIRLQMTELEKNHTEAEQQIIRNRIKRANNKLSSIIRITERLENNNGRRLGRYDNMTSIYLRKIQQYGIKESLQLGYYKFRELLKKATFRYIN